MTQQPHQLALIQQAVQKASACYDEATSLLQLADHEGFGAVLESLCLAALLLAQPSAGCTHRAQRLLDAVLDTQIKVTLDPDHGAFPLAWGAQKQRGLVVADESREILGSVLAAMLNAHEISLGQDRAFRTREAVRRAIRPADHPPPEDTAGLMLAAWLDLDCGDRWRGQKLVDRLLEAGTERLTESLWGDPRQTALTLWAIGLWQKKPQLRDHAGALLEALMTDVSGSVHPGLPELFGNSTRLSKKADDDYPWLGTWLTWHALGAAPLMPTALREPLQATLFAFPALAGLALPPETPSRFASGVMNGTLERLLPQRAVTGWSEPDLLIEASENRGTAQRCAEAGVPVAGMPVAGMPVAGMPVAGMPVAGMPVAGVRWQAGQGGSAWLQCRVSQTYSAHCSKRFVHLDDPGLTTIDIGQLGPGGTRMIDAGWWLSGLHFSTQGFEMTDAIRTPGGLTLKLKPTGPQPILMFVPLG